MDTIKARATTAQIAGLKSSGKTRMLRDETVQNLYLCVEPSGSKVWRYEAGPKGGLPRIKMTLGKYPAYGPAEAREWASARNAERDRGEDPRVVKAERQQAENTARDNTVEKTFEKWLDHKRRTKRALRSLGSYRWLMEKNLLHRVGTKPIGKLTKADIREAISEVQARGSLVVGDRLLTLVKEFLGWCVDEDLVATNVATSLQRAAGDSEGSRELSLSELALAWRAAAHLRTYDRRDAVRLLILTATRKLEAFAAPHSEYRDGVWTYTLERSKTHREHPMLLGPHGRMIFESRASNGRDHLFHDRPYPFMFHHISAELREEMEKLAGHPIERFTLHGLRKGAGTAINSDEMDALGETFNELDVEVILNHAIPKLRRTYNKARHAAKIARALAAWERLLMIEVAKQTGDNIVFLRFPQLSALEQRRLALRAELAEIEAAIEAHGSQQSKRLISAA